MLKFFLSFSLIIIVLNAKELQKQYFTHSNDINLSIITKDYQNDKTIYHIDRDRYSLRIRTKNLIDILKQNGYYGYKSKYGYITFIKQSNIDFSKIKEKLKEYYHNNYAQIDIKSIKIIPRTHIKKLPNNYILNIRKRSFLTSNPIFSIKLQNKRQIFFQAFIDAKLFVYKTKKRVKKSTPLNALNLKKVYVKLDRFRAKPIQNIDNIQAKFHLSKNKIITSRDIQKLFLVKRGSMVNVALKDSDLEIDFSARALQGGSIGDTIIIQNKNFKKFRARVIGKNKVEIEAVK
jgi:flagella basal body P-ring formation protein FlgA